MFLIRKAKDDKLKIVNVLTTGEADEDVGYWRKANHIHNWFVENVQNGNDDCGYYEVTKDKLLELLNIANKIFKMKTKIKEIKIAQKAIKIAQKELPTKSGFFFGGLEYDEYYFDSLNETIQIIEKVLAETDFNIQKIIYHSSW